MRTRSSRTHTPEGKQEVETEWEWQGDDGQWVSYPPAECAEINGAVHAGRKRVSLGSRYELDLMKMTQTNSVTKYRRNIRKLVSNDAGQGTSGLGIKEEEEPVTKKRRGGVRKGSKVCEDAGQGTSGLRIKEEKEGEEPVTKKRRGGVRKGDSTEESDSKEVVKTVLMKGKAPVDTECKVKLGKAHVYSEGNDVYDVMLNQTNLQYNNNKYYLIQLLQDDHAQSYSVWMRWGRVGHVGQNKLEPCGDDLAKAKDVFINKFFAKTKNEWTARENFKKVPGKYDMLFMDYGGSDEVDSRDMVSTASVMKQSQLDVKLQSLMDLICDIKAMEECVLQMKFDTKKAPLGKLTVEQIRAGYSSLKRIEQCLKKKKNHKELVEACNEFYTRIPHDFGLRSPPVISSEHELKEKITLLETLSDIQIAVKMVQSRSESDEHSLDKHYRALNCVLQPLDSQTHEYKVILEYLQSTHADTHNSYTMTVLDVFSVDRAGERDQFLSSLHNRMLLWHGSRLSNWVGILSQGLRVAPPEAPVTGYMFGKGIYFADMSSKSANYCFPNVNNTEGLLLLSEVALGDCNELVSADYNAASLPTGKRSTKGLGQTAPDPDNFTTLDGATVPLGPGVKTNIDQDAGYTLLYNEYVVYDPAQVRMKYLLRVQFNFNF
ncbi:poly [ADP-ribose] polymerase 2 isoform X2 [Clarias gariepinus]|nr:poly [ADP-ribose] polymerase 2 isoform X2 [Clarias gariepinus]